MMTLILIFEPTWDEDITHVWNAEERNVFRAVVGIKLFKSSDVRSSEDNYISDAYFLTGEFKEHETKQIKYEPKETYDIFYWKKTMESLIIKN